MARDLTELNTAAVMGLYKAALLLCGSILEGVLLDVLGRNVGLAASFLRKGRWPDDASLHHLLEAATKVQLIAGDGSVRTLLGPTAAKMGEIVTDHRDLVHPAAEVRTQIRVDGHTMQAMVALVNLVFRDLQDASKSGLMTAYEQGKTP